MTAATRTHVTFLIDRSGSMASQEQGVREGFAAFVAEQQKVEGKLRMTVIQFDSDQPSEVLVDDTLIGKVDPKGALELFRPRGMTPLYDATVAAIEYTRGGLDRRTGQGKPTDHVIFVVFTDGMENASTEHTYTSLTALVKEREEAGWTFVYLGANHDAYGQAASIGTHALNTQSYAGTAVGAVAAYGSLSRATTSQRSGATGVVGAANTAFFVDKDAEDALNAAK